MAKKSKTKDYRKIQFKLVRKVFFIIIMSVISLGILFPFILTVITSFKSMAEIQAEKFIFFPEKIRFENYINAFNKGNWSRYFFNSAFVSVAAVGGSLLFNSMAGYAFARLKFRYRNPLFMFALIGMMVPPQLTMIPVFIMMKNIPLFGGNNIFGQGGIGWINSYWGLIIPHLAGAFGVFLFRQYYLNFPKSLDEAANIDGCGKFRTYFEIYLPLSGPVLATLAVLKTTFSWNEYTWPLILTNTPEMMTVQLGLANFRTEYNTQLNQLMAATSVVILPILILYIVLQKYFVKGVVTSGIKG